jgi:2-keto-4-pentenoate hydratase
MFSAQEVARYLDEAHRSRAHYQNLPDAIAPGNFDEAYAAQEALCALWEPRLGRIVGRKIASPPRSCRS